MLGLYKLGFWRRLRMLPARLHLGFWPEEVWSLDVTIARYALPRLRHLRDIDHGHPASITATEWRAIQDEIIWTLESVADDSKWYTLDDYASDDERFAAIRTLEARRQAGCELFGKWFQCLWC